MVHDAGFAEVDLEVLNFEERHGFGSLVRASPEDLGDIQFLISRNRPSLDRVREIIDHFPEPAKGRAPDFCAPKACFSMVEALSGAASAGASVLHSSR